MKQLIRKNKLRPNSRCGESRDLGFGFVGQMGADFAVRRWLESRYRPPRACCSRNVGAAKNRKVKHREGAQPMLHYLEPKSSSRTAEIAVRIAGSGTPLWLKRNPFGKGGSLRSTFRLMPHQPPAVPTIHLHFQLLA